MPPHPGAGGGGHPQWGTLRGSTGRRVECARTQAGAPTQQVPLSGRRSWLGELQRENAVGGIPACSSPCPLSAPAPSPAGSAPYRVGSVIAFRSGSRRRLEAPAAGLLARGAFKACLGCVCLSPGPGEPVQTAGLGLRRAHPPWPAGLSPLWPLHLELVAWTRTFQGAGVSCEAKRRETSGTRPWARGPVPGKRPLRRPRAPRTRSVLGLPGAGEAEQRAGGEGALWPAAAALSLQRWPGRCPWPPTGGRRPCPGATYLFPDRFNSRKKENYTGAFQ
ncbi:translation initiation factor IF-2-like [Equus quagga]|uniref:translation initiation factor IF-2-like n=1 Tax=Equus quagga TaxID=89248 RepID=UPI001EE25B63|nr:translation initiation factor IF-2-like [Equus quagga]